MLAEPLRYDPAIERPEPDEAETAQSIVEAMRGIAERTFRDHGHAVRSVHAKSHGILRGECVILDDLAPALRQGIAARPGRYPVVMRFSTNPGDILDDTISTPRGLAVKLMGVEGDRLPGSEADRTQDFLLVDGPAFLVPTARDFLRSLRLLAATTDRVETLKKAVSFVARNAEAALEAIGSQSPTLIGLGGHPETHILGETFYSQVPMLWGEHIVKVAVAPLSPRLTELTDAPVELGGRPDGLRDAVVAFFADLGGEWELRVQFCRDLDAMPIEDAAALWDEDRSPFLPAARIRVPPQIAWTAGSGRVEDRLSFSPWHGLAAHRPLGSIMRVRRLAYEAGRQFRAAHNHVAIEEPAGAAR